MAWPCKSPDPEQEAGYLASLSQVSNAKWALAASPASHLAEARNKARLHRAQVAEGSDPIFAASGHSERRCRRSDVAKDFRRGHRTYIAQHEKFWKNEKHGAQWASTLRAYAEPVIGQLLGRDVISALRSCVTTVCSGCERDPGQCPQQQPDGGMALIVPLVLNLAAKCAWGAVDRNAQNVVCKPD